MFLQAVKQSSVQEDEDGGEDVDGDGDDSDGKGRGQLKKNVFFRALPELPKPPPMTPIRATWSSFFGSRNSRFESQFRT